MREVSFRGKRVDNGEWVQGDLVQGVEKQQGLLFLWCKDKHSPTGIFEFNIITETVGQYTGLTDKNGTKIFEGDILSSDWGYKGAVEFEDIIYANQECLFNEDCEVIGNIHDNPELLEV